MTIVLGFDPSSGTKATGTTAWAVLEMRSAFDRARYIAKGEMLATEAELVARIAEHGVEVVGVEDPEGYVFHIARSKALLETKGVATRLATWAGSRLPTVTMPCSKIRTGLIGRPKGGGSHGDPAVKRYVLMFVEGWPKEKHLSNNHERDAALAAIVAGRTTLCEKRDARGRRPA